MMVYIDWTKGGKKNIWTETEATAGRGKEASPSSVLQKRKSPRPRCINSAHRMALDHHQWNVSSPRIKRTILAQYFEPNDKCHLHFTGTVKYEKYSLYPKVTPQLRK